MTDEEKYLVTVSFYNEDNKRTFGVKYFLTTPIITGPDWEENDDRWWTYNPMEPVKEHFLKWYKKNIKDGFDGNILFVEPFDAVIANAKEL